VSLKRLHKSTRSDGVTTQKAHNKSYGILCIVHRLNCMHGATAVLTLDAGLLARSRSQWPRGLQRRS